MPVKDIQTRGPRLSRLGVIRLGIKKVSSGGKEYPADTDHFVLTDAPDIVKPYGDAPHELLIYLPFDTVDENFPAHHELWSQTGCLCRGDGERILDRLVGTERTVRAGQVMKAYGEEDGTQYQIGDVVECPGLDAEERGFYPRCADCRPRGMLIVMVRDPERPTQLVNDRLGYYQISTHSYFNIQNLTSHLQYAANLAMQMGRGLRGIPMILRREEKEITYTDKKANQRKTAKKWLLTLEFDLQWVRMANATMHQLALSAPLDVRALPAGAVVDAETGEILDEFDDQPVQQKLVQTVRSARPYSPEQFRAKWDELLPGYEKKHPGELPNSLAVELEGKLLEFFSDADNPRQAVASALMFIVGRVFTPEALTHRLKLGEAKLLAKILEDGAAISEIRSIARAAVTGQQDELPDTQAA